MELPTLYHRAKTGKIVEWKCWTIGPEVHVEWGEIGGKKQTTKTTSTIKNVGKKNEVSPEKQAESEAQSMWQHRVDRKYSETIEGSKETVFLPMLAHEWEKCKKKVTYPVDVQPKLDGLRAMACWQDDKIVLLSRSGLPWNIPHIENALAEFLPKGWVLDGEIYKPGLNLQGINKLAKKHREGPDGTVSLRFYAFDLFHPEQDKPWKKRVWDLHLLMTEAPLPIYVVDECTAKDEKEVLESMQEYVEKGYEGAIVRKLDGLYTLGERSRDLLKVKAFVDDEFEIIMHYLGEGKHAGCVGFWCLTKDRKNQFKCYPRGTLEQRREYGINPEQYYGKMLKVRYQFLTDDDKPFLPIGLAIRLEEDIS